MHFLLAAQLPPAIRGDAPLQRASRVRCFPFGTALGIAIAAGINYRPYRTCLPSLIVVRVVNLLFDLALASISRGENDASLPAKLPAGYRILQIPSTKMNPAPTITDWQNRKVEHCIINIYHREETRIKKKERKNTFASAVTRNGPSQLFGLDTETSFLSSCATMSNIIFPLCKCRRRKPRFSVQARAAFSFLNWTMKYGLRAYCGSWSRAPIRRDFSAYTVQWPCASPRCTALGATERTVVYRDVYSVRTGLRSRRRGTLSVSLPRDRKD